MSHGPRWQTPSRPLDPLGRQQKRADVLPRARRAISVSGMLFTTVTLSSLFPSRVDIRAFALSSTAKRSPESSLNASRKPADLNARLT
eukprot:185733-Pyramimonas_sp.AAC.1